MVFVEVLPNRWLRGWAITGVSLDEHQVEVLVTTPGGFRTTMAHAFPSPAEAEKWATDLLRDAARAGRREPMPAPVGLA